MAKGNNIKRDSILDAAYTLFINQGYYDTKIIDIADAAGIGKGTVYEYFESKDAIFLELFRTKVMAGYENLSELLVKDITCEKKIKEYIEFELKNSSKYTFNKNFLVDLMVKSDVLRNRELIDSIHNLVNRKFSIIYQIIDDGIKTGEFNQVDPVLATISIMGAINFYIGFHCSPINLSEVLPDKKDITWEEIQDKEAFFQLILHGLKS